MNGRGSSPGEQSPSEGVSGVDRPSSVIGIIADSHGSVEAIERAATFLTGKGCRSIYHLGDIGDTTYPETVEDCIVSLRRWRIKAVRGNNDHVIARYSCEHDEFTLSDDAIRFLLDLPLIRTLDPAVFFHSLPFVEELGMAAMIRVMDESMVRRCFEQYPSRILFRGHSHEPEIRFSEGDRIASLPLRPGEPLPLRDRIPCVVTCGALTRGYCMVYLPGNALLASYRLANVTA